MEIRLPNVQELCRSVVGQSATALRAQRVTRRQARLAETEILEPDRAELHDLNRLIRKVVEDARPLCEALGIRLVLQQDPRLPSVPILVRPLEDALAAALDLCLEERTSEIRVRTEVRGDWVVATLSRLARRSDLDWPEPHSAMRWHTAGNMGTVELLVGDRTSRALGGRMVVQQRGGTELRLRLELPVRGCPNEGWQVTTDTPPSRRLQRAPDLGFPSSIPEPVSQMLIGA
jgi:hypothetical protein